MSAHPGEADLRSLMEPIARRLLGEPNPRHSTAKELRWGTNGSLSVDLAKGTWYDHETTVGGGVVDFVMHQLLLTREQAWTWLREEYPSAFPTRTPAPTKKPNGDGRHGRVEKTYPYVDATGRLLSQVQRWTDPKGFSQRRPLKNGDWANDRHGVPDVPYRLPEVLAAKEAGRDIFLVEGEKDVDRLWAEGFAATTNQGGAGKWKSALNPYFEGASVVVLGDHDPQAKDKEGRLLWHPDGRPRLPGQDHAVSVATQLAPVAQRVRLLKDLAEAWPACPLKGDASDFFDAGKAPADLEAIAASLPAWRPDDGGPRPSLAFTADTLAPIPVPPRVWHVEGLIPSNTVTLMGGDGGVGKSTLALQLACATAAGLDWLGLRPRIGRSLYVSCEDDRDELHRRLDLIGLHYGRGLDAFGSLKLWSLATEDAILVLGQPGQPLQDTGRWTEFKGMVADWQPTLVVIDSLADVYGASENDRALVRGFVRMLIGVASACTSAIVMLAHPSLTGLSSGSGLSGSTAWNNSVRSRLYLTLPPTEDDAPAATDLRLLQVKKANYGPAGGDLTVRYELGAFVLDGLQAPGNSLDRALAADRVDQLFLDLLTRFTVQRRAVSHQIGRNYAPSLFAQEPEARGVTMAAFRMAMTRLFAAEKIKVIEEGSPTRRRSRLLPA